MEITIKGDFKEGREIMKTYRAERVKLINKSAKNQKQLESLEKSIPVYSVSKTIPARYEGVIVNGKLLKAFMKKLKGLQYDFVVGDDHLKVRYGKIPDKWIGELVLYDLSSYFEGFPNVPELVIGRE